MANLIEIIKDRLGIPLRKAKSRINKAQLNNEKLLDLRDLGITSKKLTKLFPLIIEKIPELESLDLGGNKIDTVPIRINELTELKGLYLDSNHFKTIPKVIESLSQLEILYFSDNALKKLPKTLSKLENLILLQLSNNPLSHTSMIWSYATFPEGVVEISNIARIEAKVYLGKLKNIFGENFQATFDKIEALDRGEFKYDSDKKMTHTGREVIHDFLKGVPDESSSGVYNLSAKSFINDALHDNTLEADNALQMMATSLGNCETPIKKLLEQLAANKDDLLICKNALSEEISKKLSKHFKNDLESSETKEALLNSLYLDGAHLDLDNKVKIIGNKEHLPSTTRSIDFAFDRVSKSLAKDFAKMICTTDEKDKLNKNEDGYYIFDPQKYRTITEPYLKDLGIVSDRGKLENNYERHMQSFLSEKKNAHLLQEYDKEEVKPLLNIYTQKEELKGLLIEAPDNEIENVFKNYLDKQGKKVSELAKKYGVQEPILERSTSLNDYKRSSSKDTQTSKVSKKSSISIG